MERKIIWICMFIGSAVGGLIPVLWKGSTFSLSAILCAGIGGFLGIWVGFKITR